MPSFHWIDLEVHVREHDCRLPQDQILNPRTLIFCLILPDCFGLHFSSSNSSVSWYISVHFCWYLVLCHYCWMESTRLKDSTNTMEKVKFFLSRKSQHFIVFLKFMLYTSNNYVYLVHCHCSWPLNYESHLNFILNLILSTKCSCHIYFYYM